jgi:dihydrofolate reductase
MRNLVYAINLSADGCCDHTKMVGREEDLEHYRELFATVDVQIFGRKTYELMVPYWPDVAKDPTESEASRRFGEAFLALDRVVFSRTLKRVDEQNTTLISGDLKEEVLQLKRAPGRKILVGGVEVPGQLMEMGLVDEFHFVVQPVLVGQGRRLGEGVSLAERLDLKLVETKVLKSGAVALHYVKL